MTGPGAARHRDPLASGRSVIHLHGGPDLRERLVGDGVRAIVPVPQDRPELRRIGHGLGAAGALETIAALQSIAEAFVHPTLNLENQDPECDILVVGKDGARRDVHRVLVNNFGFGGHNGVLAIQSFSE